MIYCDSSAAGSHLYSLCGRVGRSSRLSEASYSLILKIGVVDRLDCVLAQSAYRIKSIASYEQLHLVFSPELIGDSIVGIDRSSSS